MVTWTNLRRLFFDPTVVSRFPLYMWFALHIFPDNLEANNGKPDKIYCFFFFELDRVTEHLPIPYHRGKPDYRGKGNLVV
jgi:hypothetical protein